MSKDNSFSKMSQTSPVDKYETLWGITQFMVWHLEENMADYCGAGWPWHCLATSMVIDNLT